VEWFLVFEAAAAYFLDEFVVEFWPLY